MKLTAENMNSAKQGPLSESFKIQTQELEKLEQLRDRIAELEKENNFLTKDSKPQRFVSIHCTTFVQKFKLIKF